VGQAFLPVKKWHGPLAYAAVAPGEASSAAGASEDWNLSVTIVDAGTGKPVPAAVRLHDSQQRLLIPDSALDLCGLAGSGSRRQSSLPEREAAVLPCLVSFRLLLS